MVVLMAKHKMSPVITPGWKLLKMQQHSIVEMPSISRYCWTAFRLHKEPLPHRRVFFFLQNKRSTADREAMGKPRGLVHFRQISETPVSRSQCGVRRQRPGVRLQDAAVNIEQRECKCDSGCKLVTACEAVITEACTLS